MSLCQSVRMEQLGSQWLEIHEILYLSIFSKICRKKKVLLKSDKNNGTLHEDLCTRMIVSH